MKNKKVAHVFVTFWKKKKRKENCQHDNLSQDKMAVKTL